MDEQLKENIQSLANRIRSQAHEMRVDTLLSFLYTSEIVDKYLEYEIGDQPITRAGFQILHLLILNQGTMMPTEISCKTWRSKHAVTKVIDTLEKEGFVRRLNTEDNGDRRVRRITITEKGLDLVNKATIDSRERMSQKLFRELSKEDLEYFNRILKVLRNDTLNLIHGFEQEK